MARHFIADSEDEEDDVSPLSPPPVTLPALAAGQSSDPLSRGTDSTDTVFFKSIYQEHADAVQECTKDETKAARHASAKRASGGEGMWDVPSSPDAPPASSRRKRRKMSNQEETSPPLGTGDELETGPSMLPPTLQIDNEAAFVITPNTMTKSQREAYQDIDYGSSLDRGPASTLQGLGQRLLDIASSSSGTNLNTPRTVGGLTQLANTQDLLPTAPVDTQQDEIPPQEPVVPRPRRLSSPDVIAVAETTDLHDQYHKPTGSDDGDARAQELSAHDEDDLEECHEPIVIGDDDDSPFEDAPVKPKKRRGRPKKPKSDGAAHHVEPEPAMPTITEKPGKKKRGRPRKSHLTPEKAARLTASEPEGEYGLDESPRPETQVPRHSKNAKEEEAGTNRTPDRQQDQGLVKMEESKEKADTKPIVASKQVEEPPSKGHDEKGIKAEKGKCTQIGAREEGKPVYRVGLSKRTRIAPLLKIIRK